MIEAKDRILELKNQTAVTGIDFISVDKDTQTTLDVHFLLQPSMMTSPLFNGLTADHIHIYNELGIVPPKPVTNLAWINGNDVMQLTVATPGDFTLYKLFIDDPRVDPYYNNVTFDFKANCPSDLDCKPPDHECPPEEPVDFPIDYLARDFWSYRQALMEFASLRYPGWKDRLAADAGVMLAEVMSALGDEMAYYQDRIAREGFLESATQRRSIRRLARLVDYNIGNCIGAFAWIDVRALPGKSGFVLAGTDVWAVSDNGNRVDFEFGKGLSEALNGEQYFINSNINTFDCYRWDEDQLCLPVGTTEVYVSGHHAADLAFNQPAHKWVLLETLPINPAQPVRKQVVQLLRVTDTTDPVTLIPITRLEWDEKDATLFEMDMTVLQVHANLLPATAGRTWSYYLITGADIAELDEPGKSLLEAKAFLESRDILQAVERCGSNKSVAFLSSLPVTEQQPLIWLGKSRANAFPEIDVTPLSFNGGVWSGGIPWTWKPSLVGINSSSPQSEEYTLEDGLWRRVVGYQRNGEEVVHRDYASGAGTTIRFGDGEFGLIPAEKSVFLVHYRTGVGAAGNVGQGAISEFDNSLSNLIDTVSNPLNATNGADPETDDEIRQSAPHAFKEITYRAVRPEDYAAAAERLPWVQKAGASLRWTGSWLTVFVTPDPKRAVAVTDQWRVDLENQLNRYRQAGREAFTLNPRYADIDLEIDVCVAPEFFRGEVKERILKALLGSRGLLYKPGFFSADNFTFGTPLERSRIEAAIQDIVGVKAVEGIRYRRRGVFDWKPFTEFYYDPGKDTIIRVENDLLHPERGTLKIHTHGGA
ncbi:MAG TPA: baseplate J/gp47 family protein [Anaerolineales bacterium]|nr:baseplate J/gp47 family protein [Anaerolineales bacterium]